MMTFGDLNMVTIISLSPAIIIVIAISILTTIELFKGGDL